MARPLSKSRICAVVTASIGLAPRAAVAAPNDEAALRLRDQAIYTDYLATNFADASRKLEDALALCAASADCAPNVRARILCDLGAMEVLLHHPDDGRAHFAAALRQDSTLDLDADISSPELQREWAAAKVKPTVEATGDMSRDSVAAPTDCPPAFPGCHSNAKTQACVSDDECSGRSCSDGECVDRDANTPPVRAPYLRNWVSVAFQADALLMPSANNACAGGTGYTCFGNDGSYYGDTPLSGADDQVSGGIALATSRILLGYDRAIRENVTIGARLGYALGGGPQRPAANAFMPVHVEARGAYWFGDNPLARSGLRFYVLAAGGAAQLDASVPVDVYANVGAYQSGQSQDYRAWKKTGLGFGALGAGAVYAFTAATGIALEAKAMEMFPTPATGFGLQLAYFAGL